MFWSLLKVLSLTECTTRHHLQLIEMRQWPIKNQAKTNFEKQRTSTIIIRSLFLKMFKCLNLLLK